MPRIHTTHPKHGGKDIAMHCLRRMSHSSSRSHAICTWAAPGGIEEESKGGCGWICNYATLCARHNSQARYRSRRRVHLLNIGIQQCQNVSMNKFRHKVAKLGYLSISKIVENGKLLAKIGECRNADSFVRSFSTAIYPSNCGRRRGGVSSSLTPPASFAVVVYP